MRSLPDLPAWDRFFLVVPDHRIDPGDNYRTGFKRSCPDQILPQLELLGATDFVKQAERRIRKTANQGRDSA